MTGLISHGRLSVVDMCPAPVADSASWRAGAQLLLWRVGLWVTFVVVLLSAFGVAVTLEHVLGQVVEVVRTSRGQST